MSKTVRKVAQLLEVATKHPNEAVRKEAFRRSLLPIALLLASGGLMASGRGPKPVEDALRSAGSQAQGYLGKGYSDVRDWWTGETAARNKAEQEAAVLEASKIEEEKARAAEHADRNSAVRESRSVDITPETDVIDEFNLVPR